MARTWTLCALGALLWMCGCAAHSGGSQASEIKVSSQDVEPRNLSPEERVELRSLLEVFYSGNRTKWAEARERIVAMGPEGIDALAIFLVKFFLLGRGSDDPNSRSEDIAGYWAEARKNLVLLGEKAVPYLIATMGYHAAGTSGRLQCSMSLSEIGPPAVPMLVENLGRGSPEFQRTLLDTLGSIGDRKSAGAIAAFYRSLPAPKVESEEEDDETFGVRYYCIKAVGRIRDCEGLPVLDQGLKDPNPAIRRKAIEMAAEFSEQQALPTLQEALSLSRRECPGMTGRLQRRIRQASGQRPPE